MVPPDDVAALQIVFCDGSLAFHCLAFLGDPFGVVRVPPGGLPAASVATRLVEKAPRNRDEQRHLPNSVIIHHFVPSHPLLSPDLRNCGTACLHLLYLCSLSFPLSLPHITHSRWSNTVSRVPRAWT
jgi:hypothetical protein